MTFLNENLHPFPPARFVDALKFEAPEIMSPGFSFLTLATGFLNNIDSRRDFISVAGLYEKLPQQPVFLQ